MKNFALSATTFESIKDAEKKVNNWFNNGGDKLNHKTKLYKVTEEYIIKLKFKKI